MPVVLGIDAAWTEREPSGVALVTGDKSAWRCVALAPSYAAFLDLAEGQSFDWKNSRVKVGPADADKLLKAARILAGLDVQVVAIDLPMATVPITGRRAADTAISRAFGGRGCSTHSPSIARPGPLSERLRTQFEASGFLFSTVGAERLQVPQLIEVYPHVALLRLLSAPYRIKWKISKIRKYWPNQDQAQRIVSLLQVWQNILGGLRREFREIPLTLPSPGSVHVLSHLKRYEDVIDALASAWVGPASWKVELSRTVTGQERFGFRLLTRTFSCDERNDGVI